MQHSTSFRDTALATADSIGARLCRDAIWADDRCNWLGDSMEAVQTSWTVVHRACGPELYGGTSGIALFLTRLYQQTGERVFRLTAEGAIRQALSRLDTISPTLADSFYSGRLGIAYVLAQLALACDRGVYFEQAIEIVRESARVAPEPNELDVISGSAGAIPALLALHRMTQDQQLLDRAVRHGQHLLTSAQRQPYAWSWDTMHVPQQRHLTGFAHGTAGIAWALLELYQATHEQRFRVAAEQALSYERHWFSAQYQGWPDFRNVYDRPGGSEGMPSYGVAWCHGAAGIGLSRLQVYRLLDDDRSRQEAEIAIQTTAALLQQGGYSGHADYSLCHGMAGDAELLIAAGQVLEATAMTTVAEQVGQRGIEHYEQPRQPWPCGVPGGGETPSLMTGLAGIGYFYLRLADPPHVPSVLLVTPA